MMLQILFYSFVAVVKHLKTAFSEDCGLFGRLDAARCRSFPRDHLGGEGVVPRKRKKF